MNSAALPHIVANTLALLQVFEVVGDVGDVDEHIRTTGVRDDKAVALVGVEERDPPLGLVQHRMSYPQAPGQQVGARPLHTVVLAISAGSSGGRAFERAANGGIAFTARYP
jgi:hypothetical protein